MHPLFERYQRRWEIAYWLIRASIVVILNATSVVMEYQRRGEALPIWQPFVWEGSSQLMTLALLPLIIFANQRWPIRIGLLRRHLLIHLAGSVLFSLAHVGGMVALRHLTYAFHDAQYDFGRWTVELVYEYRKDFFAYVSILVTINVYRYIVSQLRGEATVIAEGEDIAPPNFPERLLVKKLGKEFIVKVQDIDWVEAAGNYMNLHIDNRIYPLRETMAGLEKLLDAKQFARIHRSQMVNLDRVREIQALDSGDYKVTLQSGLELSLSRRYRDRLNHLFI